ncbi:hypothetical protein JQ634_24855 [Bradyrhizobium sp. AUGA SZCCT0240]|uniref:hypothetical protein n=1 Tax=unclassified Bradyrhizobium TaxID=2631580 RepID=UPI001BA66635|nr:MULTISPECIES: hypothetical protein [unclassified Bradyrhizobium]MBR1199637.1 hypothetical protein [Bradyrhizobium sp. AUGA SZCCT0158]MBR1243854.1 hypothetical protein [Bradyrhizobium sp. AUGA SZCCT0274]MBR1256928.1 hypothetical protein [Bradyrhizobium sp. AUGA SZCCT0240]
MSRPLVFLLLGPLSVVLTTWVAVGMPFESFVPPIALALFFFTLPVSAIVGILDGQLARAMPLLLRAPVTALVGAAAAMVLPRALLGPMPQDMSVPFGLGGAFCMGLCSLLAHDYNANKTRPDDVSGSTS